MSLYLSIWLSSPVKSPAISSLREFPGVLESLHIRNLALVSELDLDFGPGMNAVTGETGAGKSLVIGAIQLLAGGRATPAVIRREEKSCEISAIIRLDQNFQELRQEIDALLEQGGLRSCEEERLLLRRVITETGSRAFVNGSPVTVGFLKELGELLIDIHGPHDNQTLLLPARQLLLLDTYAGLLPLVSLCRQRYTELLHTRQELADLKAEGLAPEEADLLTHQLREIDQAEINPEEESDLVERYRVAANSKRLLEITAACQQGLCENDGAITDQLADFLRQLRELAEVDPRAGTPLLEQLETVITSIHELGNDIADYADRLDLDEEALQRLEERLDLLQRLKRKYGPTLDDVLAAADRMRQRLAKITGRSDQLLALHEREQQCQKAHSDACAQLNAKRKTAAGPLAKAIARKLQNLGFAKAEFAIQLKAANPGPTGADAVEFAIAPNVGEAMQPLRAIASSGEMARVMLAVKTVLSDADNVPILIFDEIDANVGGRIAVTVAAELAAVSRRHQVFSITHLPQIAAAADQHFLVDKHVANERTTAVMHQLDQEQRRAELVRMLGAELDSKTAAAHADELLRKARTRA
mgnify:FL=1